MPRCPPLLLLLMMMAVVVGHSSSKRTNPIPWKSSVGEFVVEIDITPPPRARSSYLDVDVVFGETKKKKLWVQGLFVLCFEGQRQDSLSAQK